MAVRVLIVDDSEIFRAGLRTIIEAQDNWEVCGEAGDGVDAIQKSRQLTPDLIIMDLSMPGMSGLQAASEILDEFPRTPVLLLTLYLTGQLAEEAHNMGIRALMSKTAMHHLENAIAALLRGENFVAPLT
jgi:DNA-binding NarL/FixJ family response regulator